MARANCIRQTINFNEREVRVMTHLQFTVSFAVASWKTAVARTDKVTQKEPPFAIAQIAALLFFVVLTTFAVKRFRTGPMAPTLSDI